MSNTAPNSAFSSLLSIWIWLRKGGFGGLVLSSRHRLQLVSGSQNQVPASRCEGSRLFCCSQKPLPTEAWAVAASTAPNLTAAGKSSTGSTRHVTIQGLISCQLVSIHGKTVARRVKGRSRFMSLSRTTQYCFYYRKVQRNGGKKGDIKKSTEAAISFASVLVSLLFNPKGHSTAMPRNSTLRR